MKESYVFAEIHNKYGALMLENLNLVSPAVVNKFKTRKCVDLTSEKTKQRNARNN